MDLKPCPICGGTVTETNGVMGAPFLFFKCRNTKCGAVVSFDNIVANIAPLKARHNWNRRET